MVIAVLAAWCHVLCEKPMALSTAEATEMRDAAQRAGVVQLAIDHELRFSRTGKVRQLIAEGFIGQPRHVLLSFSMPPSGATRRCPGSWWYDAARGGGVLGAVGSHQIDLLRYWLGEIEGVLGTVETYVRERPDPASGGRQAVTSDDFTDLALRFASGAVGVVMLSVVTAHARGYRIEVWAMPGRSSWTSRSGCGARRPARNWPS